MLALSTGGEWCSVALHRHEDGVDESECLSEQLGAGQSGQILAMVRELCASARIGLSALDAIAFDAGPGSFTGLRVGCAVAQGLGFGLGRPLVAVDGLATLAWQRARSTRTGEAVVLVANDARMDELYVAIYRTRGHAAPGRTTPSPSGNGARGMLAPSVDTLLEPRLVARADFATAIVAAWPRRGEGACPGELLEPSQVLLGGNGWQAAGLLDEWTAHHGLAAAPAVPGRDEAYVRADMLAELALGSWRAGAVVEAAAAAPRYVRDKVALDRDEQRALRLRRSAGAALRAGDDSA